MAYVPLGKFDSALHELLYTLACHWDWADDHDGNVDGFGAYAWAMTVEREELHGQQIAEVAEEAARIDPDDATLADSIYGHWVVSTDSQGFVRVESMPDQEQLDALWQAFTDSYSRWADANEEEI